ncbi:MAG: radical SAM protein [Pseudomonadota bacterium]|nr:radical SAM protein [Pseudomonadota bacterium]
MQSLKNSSWEIDKEIQPYIHDITRGFLYVTERCNMNCRGCYVSANCKRQDFSLDFAYKAVNTLIKHGAKSITLMGGEPTLWKDIVNIVEYIIKNKVKVVIDTNCESQSLNILEKINAFNSDIKKFIRWNVSIDSHDEKKHDLARKNGNWKNVLKFVKLAKALGFTVSATCTITSETNSQILEILRFLENIGIEECNLHAISLEGNAINRKELLNSYSDWNNMREKILSINNFKDLNIRFPILYAPKDPGKLSQTIFKNIDPNKIYRCIGAHNADRLGIRANNTIHVCALIGFMGLQGFYVNNNTLKKITNKSSRSTLGLAKSNEIDLFKMFDKNKKIFCPATKYTNEEIYCQCPKDQALVCRSIKILKPSINNKNYFTKNYPSNPNLIIL